MNFLLFTTCDVKGGRLPEMVRLFKSISDSDEKSTELSFRHYVLLQRCSELPEEFADFSANNRIFIFIPNMVSLSRARNIMIKRAQLDGAFNSDGICAFPDDDAWYPDGFLDMVQSIFTSQPDLQIFTCRYGSDPQKRILSEAKQNQGFHLSDSCGKFIQTASSNTIFIKIQLAREVGYFDERLGVGARINGGEDLDYALRAFSLRDGKVALSREKLVGHRDWTAQFRGKYFSGSLFGLARSSHKSFCLRFQLLRKLMVGLYFVLRGEMTFLQFVLATRIGLEALRDHRVEVS
ncbi:MAG: hypothetical protein E6Q25_08410 [Acinetobacter sp.]|nr:MAG: hypothetical protein E6Q25_08410 [Acinetobacter sp.]